MTIELDGHSLTIEKVIDVARKKEKIAIQSDAMDRIKECRDLLERKISENEIMYGVNTGIGELSEVVLTQEQVEEYQKYLIYSHAAGYGDPIPEDAYQALENLERI